MANAKVTADPNWYVPAVVSNMAGAGGWGGEMVRKVVAFTGGAGLGAVNTVTPLFTVVGAVAFRITAICTENLASADAATLSVGTPGALTGFIGLTTATDIDAGEIWFAAAPATVLDTIANGMLSYVIGDGADIQGDVKTGTITDGTIEFTAWWTPLTAGATFVAA